MCVDYTYLNKECPKYSYSLPIINKIVENSSKYKLLLVMNSYFWYNQTHMHEANREKTVSMT